MCFLWGYLLYTGNIDRAVADDGHRQSTAGHDRPGRGHELPAAARPPSAIYALCTAVPLVFVWPPYLPPACRALRSWWSELADPLITQAEAFHVRLLCILTGTMLILSAVIVADAARRVVFAARAGAWKPELELAPGVIELE